MNKGVVFDQYTLNAGVETDSTLNLWTYVVNAC